MSLLFVHNLDTHGTSETENQVPDGREKWSKMAAKVENSFQREATGRFWGTFCWHWCECNFEAVALKFGW